jgi:hypothetical protein
VTKAQFHIRREKSDNQKDIEDLHTKCVQLQVYLDWKLQDDDEDATIQLDDLGPAEAFTIECDLPPRELIDKITTAIDSYGLLDRAGRIAAH